MAQNQSLVANILQKVILRNPIISLFQRILPKINIFSDLSNHFGSIFLKSIPTGWQKFLFLAGATSLTLSTLMFLKKVGAYAEIYLKHHSHQTKITQKTIKQKYGDCYVAVSGFTQGIGWAFVQLLLKLNMKLVLIGRNKQKIDRKVNLLKQKFQNCQIQIVIGDLSKLEDIKSICDQLKQLSKRIDIGIMINNAGAMNHGNFIKSKPQNLIDISQTNWTSVVQINRTLIPLMRSRKQRSAIINVSSCTGKYLSHYLTTYPSSKRMINVYTDFLRKQNEDKIDVLLAMPFGVSTNMMQMKKDQFIITPQNCAKSIIGDLLGGNLSTHGGLTHKIYGKIYESFTQDQVANRFYKYWKSIQNQ